MKAKLNVLILVLGVHQEYSVQTTLSNKVNYHLQINNNKIKVSDLMILKLYI